MNIKRKIALFPYFLIFYECAVYLSNDMYLPTMPAIARDLNLSQEEIQSTLTFWFLGASSLQFILGPVSDRYGRRMVIVIGGIFYVLSSAACALADNLSLLLFARFIQGTTICSVLVAGYAAIHELFDTKQAIKILAILSAIEVLAPAFGPLLGAIVTRDASWRYVFWILFVLGLIGTTMLHAYMPESNPKRHKLDLKKIMHDYWDLLLNKEFMLPSLSHSLLVSIFFLWMFEAPFLMMEQYDCSTLYYGVSQAFIFGCFFLGAWLTRHLLTNYNVAILMRVSIIITSIGVVLFSVAARVYDDMLSSIICLMVIATGASMLFGPTNRLAIEASIHPMGRRTAVFSTILSLFGALCGWVLAMVPVHDLTAIAELIIGCTALAIVSLLLTKHPPFLK